MYSSQSRASNPNLTAAEFVPAVESLELNETVLQLNIPSAVHRILENCVFKVAEVGEILSGMQIVTEYN